MGQALSNEERTQEKHSYPLGPPANDENGGGDSLAPRAGMAQENWLHEGLIGYHGVKCHSEI